LAPLHPPFSSGIKISDFSHLTHILVKLINVSFACKLEAILKKNEKRKKI
jgi:hypothetical protein